MSTQPGTAAASSNHMSEIAQRIEQMLSQVRELKARVTALESAGLPVAQPAPKGQ